MTESVARSYSLRVVQLQHLVEQVKRVAIDQLADVVPSNLLFLHLVGDEAPISVLESNFLYCIGAKQADEGYQVGDCEVFNLATIVERKDWMSLREEAQEDDATGPHIHCACLIWKVKEGFRRHVAFGTRSIFNLHRLLQRADLLDVWIVLQGLVLRVSISVDLDL